jgi:hypothetical protein
MPLLSVPSGTQRARDRPLRRSSHTLWPSAAILVSAGLLVFWLPFDVSGFRPFWHATGMTGLMLAGVVDDRNSVKSALTVSLETGYP